VFQRAGHHIGEFYKSWRSACKRAGMPGLLFHDSAAHRSAQYGACRHLRKGGDEDFGHKSRSVFDRYDIVNERDLVEAAAKLEPLPFAATGTITGTVPDSQVRNSPSEEAKLLTTKESVGGP